MKRSHRVIAKEDDKLVAIIGEYPGGITRRALEGELTARLGHPLTARVLQVALERLREEGRVRTRGKTKGRIYFPAPVVAAVPAPHPAVAASQGGQQASTSATSIIPLSAEAVRVQQRVRRPIAAREPVGYKEQWLEEYEPGDTWYLPEKVREHLAEVGRSPEEGRPAGTLARDLLDRLLIDLAWASSRLEGNTYSRLDTKNLLEFGQQATGKDQAEAQMILNHKRAIEFLVEEVDTVRVDVRTLQTLHAFLSEDLLPNKEDEGRIRTIAVTIGGSVYTPMAIPQKLDEVFRRMVHVAHNISNAFEQAFFLMVHVPYLQPFVDVNKRTSRLSANIPLIRGNLCPLSFVDVPESDYVEATKGIYEENRIELLRDLFVWAYERSAAQFRVVRESLPAPDPFRAKYRELLHEAVRTIVQEGLSPSHETVRQVADRIGIPVNDRARFGELALELVVGAHPGVLVRYQLRPSEFAGWKARFSPHENQ